MSKKFRTTAAVLAMAPVIALGSGVAAAEPAPAPAPVPVSASAPADAVQPVSLPLLFPWSFVICFPTILALPLYFACVA